MWISALLIGLAGSLHCIGMCSPLAMAVTHSRKNVIINKLIYNGGRILTYGILGAAISSFGFVLSLSAFQNTFSVLLGVVFVFMGLVGLTGIKIPVVTPAINKMTIALKSVFGKFIKQKNNGALFLLGMINGLLPCGLTYLALTYCLTLAGPIDGFNFMLLFGAGTLPAMVGFTGVLHVLVNRFQLNLAKVTRITLVVIGCLLIARVYFVHQHNHVVSASAPMVICK